MQVRRVITVLLIMASLYSCKTQEKGSIAWRPVKPYERIFLDDPLMQLGSFPGKAFEEYVQTIREGSVVPGSSVSSGGCGCN
jgi:hypothetical protein